MVKILLLVDYTRESERRLLRGLVKYANTQGGCLLYPVSNIPLEEEGHGSEIKEIATRLDVDAIFGTWLDADSAWARERKIPVVLRTQDRDYPDFPMLSGKYIEIGTMAAEFFMRQHYTNYAFIGQKGIIWSDRRLEGFRKALEARHFKTSSYLVKDSIREWNEISRWLEILPKPAALFACNDQMARNVSEICQYRGIRIPEDIALLGADDDEFLCNISFPSMSSIRLNFEKQGYELGRAIFDMVRTGDVTPRRIPIEPTVITERASTKKHNISDPFVKQIVEYLESNYQSETALEDAIASIPLSRRAVQMRFRAEMEPMTMLSYLNSIRVEHMCSLLADSNMPVSEAAGRSGFSDSLNVGRIFKKYKGLTPSAWRKRR